MQVYLVKSKEKIIGAFVTESIEELLQMVESHCSISQFEFKMLGPAGIFFEQHGIINIMQWDRENLCWHLEKSKWESLDREKIIDL